MRTSILFIGLLVVSLTFVGLGAFYTGMNQAYGQPDRLELNMTELTAQDDLKPIIIRQSDLASGNGSITSSDATDDIQANAWSVAQLIFKAPQIIGKMFHAVANALLISPVIQSILFLIILVAIIFAFVGMFANRKL